ncbi:hypothetical protein SteCoe_28399 [Stentor coeruleus]|uniref:Uncharacterized protein n=1 Tax=Stentor coeruleus TaxID=5963 RepID=A0A1R2B8V6_9CILI|nr:hypothetical protein SteCoe_28399 [Stentor coeruleus]
MRRKGSLHGRQYDMPKFDFLKTRSITSTPIPKQRTQKKMFLSLYKSLKRENKFKVVGFETRYFTLDIKEDMNKSLIIEGLLPVPVKTRMSNRSLPKNSRPSSSYASSKIKINIGHKKSNASIKSSLENSQF